jgi:hypothetical protein
MQYALRNTHCALLTWQAASISIAITFSVFSTTETALRAAKPPMLTCVHDSERPHPVPWRQ